MFLTDKIEAQKRLIVSRDEAIQHLQSLKNIEGGQDEGSAILMEQLSAMQEKIHKFAEDDDRNKRKIKGLEKDLQNKDELLAKKEEVCVCRKVQYIFWIL